MYPKVTDHAAAGHRRDLLLEPCRERLTRDAKAAVPARPSRLRVFADHVAYTLTRAVDIAHPAKPLPVPAAACRCDG
jgi:hypothetical protein